jgi:hypothetical protein
MSFYFSGCIDFIKRLSSFHLYPKHKRFVIMNEQCEISDAKMKNHIRKISDKALTIFGSIAGVSYKVSKSRDESLAVEGLVMVIQC